MAIQRLVVTVDDEALDRLVDHGHAIDITSLVTKVPSLSIIEGDASYSILVELDSSHISALQRAVAGSCYVEKDEMLDLY